MTHGFGARWPVKVAVGPANAVRSDRHGAGWPVVSLDQSLMT
ncbi:Uncharacterised protein [Mycobacteroides abscessus subsp. abscessus]|nr:Uncharacterised protein [Mycobacteroides abscessus subsp. abscessus]